MKLEAEQRRRLEMVVSSGGGGRRIHEDILVLILSRLPLKPLFRFKTVSKAWCLLIESLNLPPLFLGLFYVIRSYVVVTNFHKHLTVPHPGGIFRYIVGGGTNGGTDNNYGTIDPFLSFLPQHIPFIDILDCCNGLLLLLLNASNHYRKTSFYICNPLTKSCTQLYHLKQYCLLDFDPKVSPHFKIVTFSSPPPMAVDPVLEIHVLSSPHMTWKSYKPIRLRDPSDHQQFRLSIRYQQHALWEGSLYLLFGSNYVFFQDVGRIMRFDLLEEDHIAQRQLVEFPKGTKKPRMASIGRMRNKLCLAGLSWIKNNNPPHQPRRFPRLRVWSLSKRDQTTWVMEHDNIITSSAHLLCGGRKAPLSRTFTYIGQFHPFLDVVFILSKSMVYAYNMKNFSLNEVCHIGYDNCEICSASIFPFVPSSADYST